MKRLFERRGLGYALVVDELGVEITTSQPHRRSGDIVAEVTVSCELEGTRSVNGVLHTGRMNLSGTTTRSSLARYLNERTGQAGPIDWQDLMEDFCSRVLRAERTSRPVVRVGDRPARIAPRFQVQPVLPWRKPTTFFGAGGTGKSTLAVALGVSVQTGIVVVPGWTPTPTNVLYLDWETDEDDIDEKVKAIARGAGIDGAVTLNYLPCHGRSFSDQIEGIAEAVQETQAGFVIIDSVVHAAGTSSSEGADAAETTIRLYSSFSRLEATVLAIDHVDKASAMDPSRPAKPYGSIFKEAMARQAFEVRRADGIGTRSSMALYNTKGNLARKLAPIGLTVDQSESGDLIRYGSETVAGDLIKPLSLPAQVDSILVDGALHIKELAELLEVDEAKVRATLSRGKKTNRYMALGEGRWGLASHAV